MRTTFAVDIDGQATHFDALRRTDRWIAHGQWEERMVQIHAVAIEPPDLRLRVTTQVSLH